MSSMMNAHRWVASSSNALAAARRAGPTRPRGGVLKPAREAMNPARQEWCETLAEGFAIRLTQAERKGDCDGWYFAAIRPHVWPFEMVVNVEEVDGIAVVKWVRRGKAGSRHYYGSPRDMERRLFDRVGRYAHFEQLGPLSAKTRGIYAKRMVKALRRALEAESIHWPAQGFAAFVAKNTPAAAVNEPAENGSGEHGAAEHSSAEASTTRVAA